MKRQTRPFVVEVKKKRGDAARKQSIWGGLDLSAIAAETTERLPAVEPRHSQEKAIKPPSTSEELTVSTPMMALPEARIDPHIYARDPEHASSEVAEAGPSRPKAGRRRRAGAETLARGERWKRRLPEVLRRKK